MGIEKITFVATIPNDEFSDEISFSVVMDKKTTDTIALLQARASEITATLSVPYASISIPATTFKLITTSEGLRASDTTLLVVGSDNTFGFHVLRESDVYETESKVLI